MTRDQYDERSFRLPHARMSQEEVYRLAYTFPKSGQRDDIIQWLIESCFIENYIIKLAPYSENNIDDKIQDIYLLILEIPQSKWDDLVRQGFSAIKAYLSGLIHRQIRSISSSTYATYDLYSKRQARQSAYFWSRLDETNTPPNINEKETALSSQED